MKIKGNTDFAINIFAGVFVIILIVALVFTVDSCRDALKKEIKNIGFTDECINGTVWKKHSNGKMMYQYLENGTPVKCERVGK